MTKEFELGLDSQQGNSDDPKFVLLVKSPLNELSQDLVNIIKIMHKGEEVEVKEGDIVNKQDPALTQTTPMDTGRSSFLKFDFSGTTLSGATCYLRDESAW